MKFKVFASSEPIPDYKSNAIMYFTKSKYSHVGIIVDDLIYHATGDGVNVKAVPEFLKTHVFEFVFDITKYVNNPSYALGWCDGNLGKDYSESQLMAIMLKPFRQFGFFNDDDSEMICSEFVARFIQKCTTMPVPNDVDLDFVDPVQLIEALIKFLKPKNKE